VAALIAVLARSTDLSPSGEPTNFEGFLRISAVMSGKLSLRLDRSRRLTDQDGELRTGSLI